MRVIALALLVAACEEPTGTGDGQDSRAAMFTALARLNDPNAPVGPAMQDALRAMFAPDSAQYMGWPDLGDRSKSADLKLTLAADARRVPSRSGTRSCRGRVDCRAIAVTVRASNVSSAPVRFTIREERHGGALPRTSLVACARDAIDAKNKHAGCGPAYLVERDPRAPSPRAEPVTIELAPGQATSFDVRLDWAGTGSVIGAPLVDPGVAGTYEAGIGLVFHTAEGARVAYGDVQTVRVPLR